MKFSLVAATAAALVGSALAFGQNPAPTTPAPAPATAPAQGGPEMNDIKSKFSYAYGLGMGRRMKAESVDMDADLFAKGLRDGMGGKGTMTDPEIQTALLAFQQQLQTQAAERAKKRAETSRKDGMDYLAANAKKPGVTTLPSGLQYKVEKDGTGPSPKLDDMVTVNYEGRLIDGSVFDSSAKGGEPVKFPVGGVIKGWVEALQKMKVGSTWELTIPAELAYGDKPPGRSIIPPGAVLVFKVELLAIGK